MAENLASLSPVAASESNKVSSNDGLLALVEKVEDIDTVNICTLPTSLHRILIQRLLEICQCDCKLAL